MDDKHAAAIALLAEDVGTWDARLELRFGPDAEPTTTAGVADYRMVGGKWLVGDITTESGFAGHGVWGWSPERDCYVGIWVDVAGAGMSDLTGTWDAANATMTYEARLSFQGITTVYWEITRRVDADTREYRNLMKTPDGKEYEALSATYRRRPAS